MQKCANPPDGEPANPGRTNPPARILVVDDDFETREISALVLTRSGYLTETAPHGAEAFASLTASRYDLLITNHRMPRMSGIELMMKLHAARMALPVIMASASLPRDQFARYPWLKPAAMLVQPCTVAELLATVKKVLRETTSTREQVPSTPAPQGRPSGQLFADMMTLLRSPVFR